MQLKAHKTHARRTRISVLAFTLTELMVAMAVFTVVIGGVIYAHITGLKMYEITRARLGASESARMTLGWLTSEVRGAQKVAVGMGSASTFTTIGTGTNQEGNALQIYKSDWNSTTKSNSYIRYYRDEATSTLIRIEGSNSTSKVVAEYITNAYVFAATDTSGVVLTGNDNNKVISVILQFYQLRYPQVHIGTNEFFDFFQIATYIARRSI